MAEHESDKARLDRELIELLNELRVVLPGIQVLFAFLLAVPFQQRFGRVTTFQRDVYFATLLSGLLTIALLVAPAALHRLNFRRHDKRQIVATANRLAIAGLLWLGVALIGVILLISDVLFGPPMSIAAPAVAGLVLAVLWVFLPLRLHDPDDEDDGQPRRAAGAPFR
jgi:hypothetical protein